MSNRETLAGSFNDEISSVSSQFWSRPKKLHDEIQVEIATRAFDGDQPVPKELLLPALEISVTCSAKDIHPKGHRDPSPISFLNKILPRFLRDSPQTIKRSFVVCSLLILSALAIIAASSLHGKGASASPSSSSNPSSGNELVAELKFQNNRGSAPSNVFAATPHEDISFGIGPPTNKPSLATSPTAFPSSAVMAREETFAVAPPPTPSSTAAHSPKPTSRRLTSPPSPAPTLALTRLTLQQEEEANNLPSSRPNSSKKTMTKDKTLNGTVGDTKKSGSTRRR